MHWMYYKVPYRPIVMYVHALGANIETKVHYKE